MSAGASVRLLGSAAGTYARAAPAAPAAPAAAGARVLATVVAGLSPVAAAWLTRLLLGGLGGLPGPGVWLYALLLAAPGAAIALAQHLSRYADREIGRRVNLFTQARLFAAVTAPDGIAQLEDAAFQDRLRLAQQAGQNGPQQLSNAALSILQATLTVSGFVLTLVALSPAAAGLVLLSAVPAFAPQRRLGRQRAEVSLRITPNLRRQIFYSALLLDVRAAKEIRLFGLGEFFRARMLTELGAMQEGQRRVDRSTLRVDASTHRSRCSPRSSRASPSSGRRCGSAPGRAAPVTSVS